MTNQLSFADQERALQSNRRGIRRTAQRLETISGVIDWSRIEALLTSSFQRTEEERRKGGRPSYPAVTMFRVLLLQYLYDLSDPELEDQLLDRESFQQFVGIGSGIPVPDFTTIWRFKERLSKTDLLPQLFAEVTDHLAAQGLILRRGTIVDATVVQSEKHAPLRTTERAGYLAMQDTLQQELSSGAPATREQQSQQWKLAQIDLEARSTRKTSAKGYIAFYYGYKAHIGVDTASKLIRRGVFTSANCSDIDAYPELISGDEQAIYGDKGYVKKAYREEAIARGVEYNVLYKGEKHVRLTEEQIAFNKRQIRTRTRIEHVFGHLKTKLSLGRVTAKGLRRNKVRFYLNCILYNLERAGYLRRLSMARA